MKAIVVLKAGKFAPGRMGEFIWSKKHKAHIWQGRELGATEFNRVVDRLLDLREIHVTSPTVRMIDETSTEEQNHGRDKRLP